MPVMAARNTRWRRATEGSASRDPQDTAIKGGVSDRHGRTVARVRDRCGLPPHHRRRGDSGRRQMGAVRFSAVVRVPRRVEQQRGFLGPHARPAEAPSTLHAITLTSPKETCRPYVSMEGHCEC
jgi:hypothetical protein